jgi:hypothetical protein
MITLSSALDIYCGHLGLNAEIAAAVKRLVAPNDEGLIWLLDEPLMVQKVGSDFVVDRSELTKILDKAISR